VGPPRRGGLYLQKRMSIPEHTSEPIRTTRLLLRPMKPGDLRVISSMQMDPVVMAHYGNGQPLTQAQADETVLKYHLHCRQFDYWAWAVTLAETGEVLGQVTAGHGDIDGRPGIGLGYILKQSGWGNGYGPEAVGAVIAHGLDRLGWKCAFADVSPVNLRSLRLCEKVGMRAVREGVNTHGRLRRTYMIESPKRLPGV
jgi:RimJ/RimL family protein N-acetyltransferase